MSEIVECPYCKEYVEIEPNEHYDNYEEYKCSNCKKNFEVFAEPCTHYSVVDKIDYMMET